MPTGRYSSSPRSTPSTSSTGAAEGAPTRGPTVIEKNPARKWEFLGLVLDFPPGITYTADPYAFRDLDDTPCLILGVADGTSGFADWKFSWGYLLRSTTKSFAGPWGKPHFLWQRFPRGNGDGRMDLTNPPAE